MAISSSDLILYASANMPEDDVSTSGGAIDEQTRPVFTQLSANDTIDVVSDGTDSRDVTITGRKPNGVITSETLTLNDSTTVNGSTTFERILKVVASATDASRTITVSEASGGNTIATIPPDETGFRLMFYNSASESSQTTRYEKTFWKNEHDTLALTDAQIQLSADPDSNIRIAVEDTKDDSSSVSDRKTQPSGLTFVDDGTDQSVPGTDLEENTAVGVWAEMTLAADESPLTSSFTLQITGKST